MSTLICNIGTLQSPLGTLARGGGCQRENLRLENAAVLIENGMISEIFDSPRPTVEADNIIDTGGALVTPGLVDCHTHLVFAGWRQHEIPLKLKGASYLDILRAGGGILDTVRKTRAAGEGELARKALEDLSAMAKLGVTTVEAKSGYGLDLQTELKQLRVAKALNASQPVEIVSTFLGAHAIPDEFPGDAEGFIDMLIRDVLPQASAMAEFADVFCEDSVFNVEQSRRYLLAAAALGLKVKIHADEIEEIGGAELASELKAVTAEHLIATGERGMDAMAQSGVIAALLPATSLYLNKDFAKARQMIEKGIPVAVATDYNPGSCPSLNLQLCINLAYLKYRMFPEEILTAVTLNAACAVSRGDIVGSIERGKQADLVIWNAPDFETVCYRFGQNLAQTVLKKGEVIQ